MHVDMDCFFAAVEQREAPGLLGKPVIVGADPRRGLGRGIVATCSYEARRFGVRSAMPISTAWRLCPSAVFLRPRFSLYSQASRRVMEVLARAADVLEPAGIDEAYLDVSTLGTFEAARDRARAVQAEIRDGLGLSCAVGVAPNKLVAKIASDHRKPGGLTVVIGSRVREFLDPKPVSALRGVGPKTREALVGLGYETVAQLREASEQRLTAALGGFGAALWRQARGLDDRPVDASRQVKSMGRERTFSCDTDDMALVRRTLSHCVERVRRDLLEEASWARTLTVKVRFESYETHSRQTTLKLATASRAVLESAALSLAEPFLSAGRRVRLVGFSASSLSPAEEALPLEPGL